MVTTMRDIEFAIEQEREAQKVFHDIAVSKAINNLPPEYIIAYEKAESDYRRATRVREKAQDNYIRGI